MRAITHDGIEVNRCMSCDGIWFDLREHEHLKNTPSPEDIDPGDPEAGRELDEVRDINCPRCGVKMVKLAFPEQPHIRYELCATCGGAFLDAGEFRDFTKLTFAERANRFLRAFR
jgi:Zn-finger nucleic acid-binding protein